MGQKDVELNYSALKNVIESSPKSLYLIYGNEVNLIDEMIENIKKSFSGLSLGINYILIDESNVENLISEIEMPSFGFDKKLIIVKNTELFKKDGRRKEASPIQIKIADYINNNMDVINDSCVLIFNEITVDKNIIYKAIAINGIVANIEELKNNEVMPFLKERCKKHGVKVNDNVLMKVIENSGTNLTLLYNEIDKLIDYTGESKVITRRNGRKIRS